MLVRNHRPTTHITEGIVTTITVYKRNGDSFNILVDTTDWSWLKDYQLDMMNNGYARITDAEGVRWLLHRVILNLTDSAIWVDHVNHNKQDNRQQNLRQCTRAENQHNRVDPTRGVSYHTKRGKWDARCKLNNKVHFVGLFETKTEAIEALAKFRTINMPFSQEARSN
jgi:hypothetical protein